MAERLTGDQVECLLDALCTAFWLKAPFIDFLRRCGVSKNDLDQFHQPMTKRTYLRWLLPRYENGPDGQEFIRRIARQLCEKKTFRDLEGQDQIERAKAAIEEVRQLFAIQAVSAQLKPDGDSSAESNRARMKSPDLKRLQQEFTGILPAAGTSDGGRAFEGWFASLATEHMVTFRPKFRTPTREFDGALTVEGNTYLLELKHTRDVIGAPEVSNFRDKVRGHAAGALGILVSVPGFTKNAITTASEAQTPIILCDGAHLYRVLQGYGLARLVSELRRHSIETGNAYIPAPDLPT